ncbi:MAG: hypothetical protein ACF8XB_05175 [Planctomycetota bacterium JB042]
MRTSTVVFLVLFLCLFSSQERRSKFHSIVEEVKAHVHEATRDHIGDRRSGRKCRDSGSIVRNDETRGLKGSIRLLEEKEEAADKTLRTIDRSVRTLDDRIRKLERDAARQPHLRDVYERSLKLLLRQRIELHNEREEIVQLKERMEGEVVRLRAELDIAKIRAERKEVEAFLDRERSSPMDQLAVEEGRVGF